VNWVIASQPPSVNEVSGKCTSCKVATKKPKQC